MKTKIQITMLTAVMLYAASAQAAWLGWNEWNGSVDTDYHNAANWSLGVVPDAVGVDHYGMAVWTDVAGPVLTSSVAVDVVDVQHTAGAEFTIANGDISTVNWAVLSWTAGNTGTLNVESGASFTVGTEFFVGNDGAGILNVNGGTVNVTGGFGYGLNATGSGEVHLDSGTITAGWLASHNGTGFLDITGTGQLNITGDVTAEIAARVAAGSITADGGTSTVLTSYDGSQTHVSAVHTNVALYSNPLATPPTGADPFVLKHEGVYYMYCTAENHLTDIGIPVYTSTNLVDWSGPAGNGPSGLALHEDDVWGDYWFWGGDVIEKDGTFYMYATVEEHLVVATSDSPLGPFTQTVQEPMHTTKEIDASVFTDDDGKHYIYYVRFEGGNVEYVAELSDDLLSMKEETITFCLRAQFGTWERGPNEPQASVLEGAYAVKHNGLYYLIYTANHFESIDYSMGYATSSSPFGPWTRYSGNPILQATAELHGPGNGMVVHSPDGSEMFLCYHVHYDLNTVWPRRVALDRIWFEPDPLGGIDILVLNGPTVALQRYPSNVPPIGDVAMEWIAGTGDLALTWNTGAGYVYALQSRTNLVDEAWADDTTGILGTGGDVTVTTTVDQAEAFYRIILE